MDRVTRKANLKKLQLPKSSSSKQQRTTRQSQKTSTQNAETVISSYFVSPSKPDNSNKESKTITTEIKSHVEKPNNPNSPANPLEQKRKRTKLDAFVLKDPKNMLPEIKKELRKSLNDDDFVVPEKKVKKAPKLASNSSQTKSIKSSKKKIKQTTIRSAFLRNEQMFAEIAALHCAADQFDGNEVQLALAISKSEVDCGGSKNMNDEEADLLSEVEDIDKNADFIRDKLKKYGFRTAERKDYNSFTAAFLPKAKRLKTKWASKFTPLTLRQSDNQLRKLQNNIESLLNNQFRTKPLTVEEQYIPPYELQSSLLKRSLVTETNRILQGLSSKNQPDELFFVKELFDVNVVPAGYLLKDWSAIQGRDLTPKVKSHRHEERLKKLENIYQELEAYFSSRKCLNWTETKESLVSQTQNKKEETAKVADEIKDDKKEEIVVVEENVELDEMVKLLEDMQKDIVEIESDDLHLTTLYDKKTKELLPPNKSLDNMEVSGYSLNTQATLNTTEKTRSNSPDLFADSDIEKEEEQKEMKDETATGLNSVKKNSFSITGVNIETTDKSRNNSLEVIETDVMTYEVFSSEDGKISVTL
ncbi:hypothetical protein DOY81_002899 [Sarcophaga bullata]|nr:hypothetical protein DOY81_002899 [Sarcophaga bullata]